MSLRENNFIKIIKSLSIDKKEILIDNIIDKLSKIHNEKIEINWLDNYTVDINLSLFNHGLLKKPGLKDYIITDYLKENIYIIKDRKASRLIKNSSILNMNIKEDLSVDISVEEEYGDKILDFFEINIIAYYDREFASKLLDKAISSNHKVRYLKLLSFYTAKKTIDLIVEKSKTKHTEEVQLYDDVINFIFESYDDFTKYKPNWYENK